MTKISVIIEWENAKLSELDRAERMLSQLGRQMAAAAAARGIEAELIVLFDSEAIDEAVPRNAVETQIPAGAWPGPIRFEPAPGQHYYEQKNTGAKLATGAYLIFLDSDVIPEEGWLEALLDAVEDTNLGFVGGEAYHATDSFYDRLFAGFWTFLPRGDGRSLYKTSTFYANNLAVRRELFLANPYPDTSAYRGQCTELARGLRRGGVPIHRSGDAKVSHPPPVGFATFFVRAICQGYDAVYWRRRKQRFGSLLNANPIAAFLRFVGHIGRVLQNVVTRARRVGLGPLGALTAIGAGIVYYVAYFAGEVVAFFAPDLIRRNLNV